jgi:hypothetical protein
MNKLRIGSCSLGVAALALLLSAGASAVPLAQQCGAVGIVTYDPSETQTTGVPVPYAWLDTYVTGVAHTSEAYETLAMSTAANGRLSVAECYVLGLDPQVATNDFKITSFPMKADGTPDLEKIAFAPAKAQWNVQGARAVVKGAESLDGEWQTVTEENKAGFRFFKVEVVLP